MVRVASARRISSIPETTHDGAGGFWYVSDLVGENYWYANWRHNPHSGPTIPFMDWAEETIAVVFEAEECCLALHYEGNGIEGIGKAKSSWTTDNGAVATMEMDPSLCKARYFTGRRKLTYADLYPPTAVPPPVSYPDSDPFFAVGVLYRKAQIGYTLADPAGAVGTRS